MNLSLNSTEVDVIQHWPVQVLVYASIFGICSIIGTIGNITVILTICLSKTLRNSRNMFVVSLSTADLLVSMVTMPASISGALLGNVWFEKQATLCTLISSICAPGCVASMHSIAWIAISRYYFIGQYPTFLKFFTENKVAFYIGGIWLLGLLAHLPNHLGWGSTRFSSLYETCSFDTELYSYALFYSSILLTAIVTSFAFYFKIYLVLRKSTLSKSMILSRGQQKSKYSSQGKASAMNDEIKIIKTSFKIFILFVITWLPISLLILSNARPPIWVHLYGSLLAHCNSTLNFAVYFVENDTFRRSAQDLFRKLLKRNSAVTSLIDDKKDKKRRISKTEVSQAKS